MNAKVRSPISHVNQVDRGMPGAIRVHDYSNYKRWGLRGSSARERLISSGYTVPEAPNQIVEGKAQEWVCALSYREFWVLSAVEYLTLENSADNVTDENALPLLCQYSHAWFLLEGEHRAEMMAKLCGVDLRHAAFPEGIIAQTQIARVNAIVAHHTLADKPVFSILVDQSLAEYLWLTLHDGKYEWD